jgi:gamma-glutamyltranspeptidase/glutathione hydrolase
MPADAIADGVPLRGPLTITVPGAVAAWASMAKRWGTRPLALALEPAIALAADGVAVSPSLAAAIAADTDVLSGDEGLSNIFLPDGKALAEGERLTQPALAQTLRALAR